MKNSNNTIKLLGAVIVILLISLVTIGSRNVNASTNIFSNNKENTENACSSCKGYDKDTQFNFNTSLIKEAVLDYFTNERLPKKVNDTATITLEKMIEMKLVHNIVDSNGKSCSLTESYVEVTKKENEYVYKINLSCSDVSDYILVYKGCYDYCEDNTCEKKEEPDEKTYEYEYGKSTSCEMTDWSPWTQWKKDREEIKNPNYKREETKTEVETKKEIITKEVTINTTFNCDEYEGYELLGNLCVKSTSELLEEDAELNPTTYNCKKYADEGYVLEGTKCIKTITNKDVQPADEDEPTYNCDQYGDEYKLVGDKCVKEIITVDKQPAEEDETSYNCDKYGSEYNVEGNQCVKVTISKDEQPASPTMKTRSESYTCGTEYFECGKWVTTTKIETVCDENFNCKDVEKTSSEYQPKTCSRDKTCTRDVDYQDGWNCNKYGSEYKLEGQTCTKTTTSRDVQPADENETTYNCNKYGKDYELDGKICKKTIKTTEEKEADENEKTYNCNKYGEEYKLEEKDKCVKTTTTTDTKDADEDEPSYNCDKYDGYTLVGNKCVKPKCDICSKEAKKVETETCDEDYILENGVCKKEVEKKVNVTYYRYSTRSCEGGSRETQWSLDINDLVLKAQGFKRTGRTRLLVINK